MKKQRFTLVELLMVITVISILTTILLPLISDFVEKTNRTKDATNLKNINSKLSLKNYMPRSLACYSQMQDSSKNRKAYICPSTETAFSDSTIPDLVINTSTNESESQTDNDWVQDYYYFTMHISIEMKPKDGDKILSFIKVNDISGFNIASSFMGNHTNYGNILSGDGSVDQVEDKEWYQTGLWADIGTDFTNKAPYSSIIVDETTLTRP